MSSGCNCGSSCKCGDNCSCGSEYQETTTTKSVVVGLSPMRRGVGMGMGMVSEENGCKCGANCTCDPCKCDSCSSK